MKTILTAIVLVPAILAAGCASDTPRVDAALGKSVAKMVEAQTLDPQAAANPTALAPASGDGQRLKNALDENRKDVGKGVAEVARPVSFDVGGK
jgi:hypothetical protein